MLLLFLAQWLEGQYAVQRKRLDEDLRGLFTRTEQQLTDSLLNKTIALILSEGNDKKTHKLEVRYATTVKVDTSAGKPLDVRSLPDTEENKIVKMLGGADTLQHKTERITISTHTGQDHIPEDIQKVLRMAIVQTANAKDLYRNGFSVTADSATLHQAFRDALRLKQYRFYTQWDTAAADTAQPFHYRYRDPALAGIIIDGYRAYLLRSILPQIIFSAVLLLLIGLAFGLSYRMIKQQRLFNRQKDSFISNISHELKTPVATTKVAIEALTAFDGIRDPERTRKYLHLASWEMERLSTLIDRIMNLVQVEHGGLKLDKRPISLTGMARELVQTLQPVLEQKGIAVSLQSDPENITLTADALHLQGVLYNLIDNAVKYGGDRIMVTLAGLPEKVTLSVQDNGPGIPDGYRQKVFDNFFRVPSDDRHDVKGYGLGLSYARDIVQAHGGIISLGEAADSGAVFTITLPVNPGL